MNLQFFNSIPYYYRCFKMIMIAWLVISFTGLSAAEAEPEPAPIPETRASMPKENSGLKVPGIGICIWSPVCIVDHDKFKLFQFNLLRGSSAGFTGLQFGLINRTYGTTGLQFGIFNQDMNGRAPLQLGLINTKNQGIAVLQFGAFNDFKSGAVYGLQFAGANLADDVNIRGAQLTLGINKAKDVAGFQIGLDLHWIFTAFSSERKKYISSAENLYGIQFALITTQVKNDLIGLQYSLLNNEVSGSMLGAQVAIFRNHATKMGGLQFGLKNETEGVGGGIQAGLMNDAGSFNGVQLGFINTSVSGVNGMQLGLINHDGGVLNGLQFGLKNDTDTNSLVQIGGINTAKKNNFFQFGLWNKATDSTGVQIGLINISDNKAFLQLGILNFAKANKLPFFPIVNGDFEAEF